MIKSLIIFALLLALTAGAFLSRPKPEEFKPFIKSKIAANTGGGLAGGIAADLKADAYIDSVTIKDRLLWVTVERGGKAVYTGAFNTWFGPNDPLAATPASSAPSKK